MTRVNIEMQIRIICIINDNLISLYTGVNFKCVCLEISCNFATTKLFVAVLIASNVINISTIFDCKNSIIKGLLTYELIASIEIEKQIKNNIFFNIFNLIVFGLQN